MSTILIASSHFLWTTTLHQFPSVSSMLTLSSLVNSPSLWWRWEIAVDRKEGSNSRSYKPICIVPMYNMYSMYNIIYLRVSNFISIHRCYNVDNIHDSFVMYGFL